VEHGLDGVDLGGAWTFNGTFSSDGTTRNVTMTVNFEVDDCQFRVSPFVAMPQKAALDDTVAVYEYSTEPGSPYGTTIEVCNSGNAVLRYSQSKVSRSIPTTPQSTFSGYRAGSRAEPKRTRRHRANANASVAISTTRRARRSASATRSSGCHHDRSRSSGARRDARCRCAPEDPQTSAPRCRRSTARGRRCEDRPL